VGGRRGRVAGQTPVLGFDELQVRLHVFQN
jgi:hypothetical protein